MSRAVYSSDYASAQSYEVYQAYEARAQYGNWSPADQSAFYNYNDHYQGYQQQLYPGSQQTVQCCINLSDYTDDDSDSEGESLCQSPKGTLDLKKDLPKSLSTNPGSGDDAASTDLSGTEDQVSTSNASDESDNDSEGASPRGSSHMYSRDALLLLRVAVGMCTSPLMRWSTRPDERKSEAPPPQPEAPPSQPAMAKWMVLDEKSNRWQPVDGAEWRHAAAAHQKHKTSGSQKLVPSSTSWTAQQRSRLDDASEASQKRDEEVARSIKSILNKLTVEKFDDLYKKLIHCGICKDSHIQLLVHEVFDKACVQHHFVDMYADLCMQLERWLDDDEADTTATGFRRILLHQCQTSFERSLQKHEDLAPATSDEERMEAEIKHKQRVLGNTRFVGALLNRGMLSPRVLLACANDLLKDQSGPLALESLAVLLTTIGPTFDDKEWTQHALLCEIFAKVAVLTKNKDVPPRTRFLLQDVLELRAAKWSNVKEVTKSAEAPMKIDEVHRQAALEEMMQSKQNSQSKRGGCSHSSKSKNLSTKSDHKVMDMAESCKAPKKSKSKYTPKPKTESHEVVLKPNWSDATPPQSPTHGPRKDPKVVKKDPSATWSSGSARQRPQNAPHSSHRSRKSWGH